MKLSRNLRHIPSLIMAVAASIPIMTAFEMMTHRGSTPNGASPPLAPPRVGAPKPSSGIPPSNPSGAAPTGSPPRTGGTTSGRVTTPSGSASPTAPQSPSARRYSVKIPRIGRTSRIGARRLPKPSRGQLASRAASRPRAGRLVSGTFTGPQVSDAFGMVQASVTVVKGNIVDVAISAPKDNPLSANINSQAIRYLRTETLNAQGANINAISGATATTQAYLQSLQGALAQMPKYTASAQSNAQTGPGRSRRPNGAVRPSTGRPSGAPRLRVRGVKSLRAGAIRPVKPATSRSKSSRRASTPATRSRSGTPPLAPGTYSGPSVQDPYGVVQTSITISRGKITNVSITAPKDNAVSANINSQAIGYLRTETLNAQSANISAISGATATSQAFVQSLQGALAHVPKYTAGAKAGGQSQPTAPQTPGGNPPALPGAAASPKSSTHFAIKGGANDDSGGDDGAHGHAVTPVTVGSTPLGPTATSGGHSNSTARHFSITGGGSDEGRGDGGSSTQVQKHGKARQHTGKKRSQRGPSVKKTTPSD